MRLIIGVILFSIFLTGCQSEVKENQQTEAPVIELEKELSQAEQYVLDNGINTISKLEEYAVAIKEGRETNITGLSFVQQEMKREGINDSNRGYTLWYNLLLTDYFNAFNSLSFGDDLEEFNESLENATLDKAEFLYSLNNR